MELRPKYKIVVGNWQHWLGSLLRVIKRPSTRVLGLVCWVQLGEKDKLCSCLDSNPWRVVRPFNGPTPHPAQHAKQKEIGTFPSSFFCDKVTSLYPYSLHKVIRLHRGASVLFHGLHSTLPCSPPLFLILISQIGGYLDSAPLSHAQALRVHLCFTRKPIQPTACPSNHKAIGKQIAFCGPSSLLPCSFAPRAFADLFIFHG